MTPKSRERLKQVLADLAKGGHRQVAARLRAAGCKGDRCDCWSCPVAKYLGRKKFRDLGVYDQVYDVNTQKNLVPLPKPIRTFIKKFDDGTDYQDLMETGE